MQQHSSVDELLKPTIGYDLECSKIDCTYEKRHLFANIEIAYICACFGLK